MKVAINGFGRIGRTVLRLIINDPDVEVCAINSLSETEQLAYLYKYDSMHKTIPYDVTYGEDYIKIKDKKIKVFREDDPSNLPWKNLNVDVVFECTGAFNSTEKSMAHINAGAAHVLLSAPANDDTKTIVYKVNDYMLKKEDKVISCASCTTNALAPLVKLINDNYKIKSGFMTTVHAITNDQETLDVSHKKGIKSRRGRAASLNIIPTNTGAASQIGKVIPQMDGLMDGNSYRVPVGDGSVVEINVIIEKNVRVEDVNKLFMNSQNETIKYTTDPIVSSDIVGRTCASMVDGLLTNVIIKNGNTILKAVTWYDNEVGYSAQMIRTAKRLMSLK